MAVQDVTLNPKIFNSAKKEFLEYGYLNASVKRICENSGVTTGALYKRYKGKSELFDAVVQPTYDEFKKLGQERARNSEQLISDSKVNDFWNNSEEVYKNQMNFIYDNYEGMRLLLCCSQGTKHSDFLHLFVQGVTDKAYETSKLIYNKGLSSFLIDKDTLHMLLTAYWTAIFESIKHEYSREKALKKAKTLSLFFNWSEVMGY